MLFVSHTIVVCQDIWVSDSDLRLLMWHLRGQTVKKNSIVNTQCIRAVERSRRLVLRLLDLTLDCHKSVLIHPLLVALR
jgi:hypothetical protein